MFFHSRAHRSVIGASGIRDGMKVLEVATGSGEMFRRLVRVNPNGSTTDIANLSVFIKAHPVANPEPDDFEPDGAGPEQQDQQEVLLRLREEGLFEPARKRPIPRFPPVTIAT